MAVYARLILTVLTVLPAYLLFGAYCMFERHERLVALAGMLRLMPRRIGACELIDIPVEQLIDVFRTGIGERA